MKMYKVHIVTGIRRYAIADDIEKRQIDDPRINGEMGVKI
jgi:hypothetical protein